MKYLALPNNFHCHLSVDIQDVGCYGKTHFVRPWYDAIYNINSSSSNNNNNNNNLRKLRAPFMYGLTAITT